MPSRVIDYRALAVGIEHDGHPVQKVSGSMNDIHDWAQCTMKRYNCVVKIYVTHEFLLKSVKPTPVTKSGEEKKVNNLDKLEKLQQCKVCGNLDCTRQSHREQVKEY